MIWLHAVSVGEVLAVSRLVTELGPQLSRNSQLLISTTTRTGQALARERFGANRVFYCPLDLPWAVRAYLNALKPRLLILAETEFWPNLLSGCFRRRIPVAVVNARISDRSWPRYRRLRRLWQPFLQPLSRVLAQSETDADRLEAIGCLPRARHCRRQSQIRCARRRGSRGHAPAANRWPPDLRLVVAGSTLEGEEAALLEAWPRLLEADPKLAMVLAPRHPERFAAVGCAARQIRHSVGAAFGMEHSAAEAPAPLPRPDRPARHHRRTGLGLLAGLCRVRRRQPRSRRRS